ncbi:hypothetical protein SAMN05216350_1064 [Polaromonas sp. YR568]|uniref:hypothetical protein n=1 Tax=Polaromonas sp. YR568 TaxID=1855301 RepID=UPI0008E94D1D|nr:hypothetical protein [Polaromonas sp. YR568]SFU83117.1 hypothetical protein SAMN05216350_1064 [Polaromonas sp. YR568]
METYSIFLIGGTDDERATLVEDEIGDNCNLKLVWRNRESTASAEDFFEALCAIRLQLEAEGLLLFCYGASLNVYPSGMARSMAGGKVAYKMQAGKHVTTADLVDIFSEGPDVIPATVKQQREYFEEWVSSDRVKP